MALAGPKTSHGAYVLDWKGAACCELSADGLKARFRAHPGAAPVSVGILRRLARALAQSLQGRESLHATALLPPKAGKAVALLGLSGEGKSTLAACLIGRGWRIICDDVLPFAFQNGEALARPSAAVLKLSPKAVGHSLNGALSKEFDPNFKKWIFRFPDMSGNRPLGAAVFLARFPHGPVRLRPIRGAKAALWLQNGFYNVALRPESVLRRQFGLAAGLARRVPVFRLSYPSGFKRLGLAAKALEEAFGR